MNLDGAVDVDVAAGLATAQKVSGIVDEMQQTVGRIANAANTGLASWTGKASGAFEGVHVDWNSSATALNNALDDIRNKLTAGFSGYEDHDTQASNAFPTDGPLRI